jgi:hypothetical protein
MNEVKNKFVEIDPFSTPNNKIGPKNKNISESLPQGSSVIYKDKTPAASSHDHISRRPNPVMEEYKTETITIINDKRDHQKKRNKKKDDSKNKEKHTTSKKNTNTKNKENSKKYSKQSSDKIPNDKDTVIDDFNKLVNILEDEIRDIGEVFRNLTIDSINYNSSFLLFFNFLFLYVSYNTPTHFINLKK